MTLYEFNAMNEDAQAEVLWERGVYLMARQQREYKFALYQLDAFYVEVWYHVDGNEITRLRSFSSTGPLEPYLEEIALPEIF
jgi:hypothetical protein